MSTPEEYFTFDLAQLGNMASGRLAEQFGLAVANIAGDIQSEHVKRDGNGRATGEITIKVKLTAKEPKNGATGIEVAANITSKSPAPKTAGAMLREIGGSIVIGVQSEEAQQGALPLRSIK